MIKISSIVFPALCEDTRNICNEARVQGSDLDGGEMVSRFWRDSGDMMEWWWCISNF